MKNRTTFLNALLIIVFFFFGRFAHFLSAQNTSGKDDIFKDNPIAERFDSLANLAFFNEEKFTTDWTRLNKYNFPLDSVPTYPDSVYRARIRELNINSPFEFIFNDQVKEYIDYFGVKKRRFMSRVMGLAELYFPLFEEQMDIHGIPLEMKYLAVIESALNPVARSRAGACGLWQFMLNTGKLYNLNVTSYVDDRFDPYKSTVAACRHLNDLYNIYHDWAIVLAAYNAGAGCINRAIREAGFDSTEIVTYWKIRKYLPRETQNYVPSFIAVTYLMNYAAEHNLYPMAPEFIFAQVDTVSVRQSLTFSQISSYLCIPVEQIQFLNPAYKKGVIPATAGKPYVLRLPREKINEFISNQYAIYNYKSDKEIEYEKVLALAEVTKTTPPATSAQTASGQSSSGTKYVYHTVQKGDSLWSIASRYKGVTVEDLRRLNNLSKSSMIHPGQKLKVAVKG